ncbi:glycosyltransferase [Halorientalis halophila]|uniref:glycosyltransferase n=1 Tax=Halorientalis halophila TaxID=3108499 RepID=UPI00300A9C69
MMRVLWLTPDKPENISVGRARIAAHLRERDVDVTLRAGSPATLWELVTGDADYDAVVGTTRAGAIVGAAASVARGIPLVVDHVDPIRQFAETNSWPLAAAVKQLEHLAFRRSAHTLYVYPEEADRVERFAPAATRTDLGVEFERFAATDEQILDRARERLAEYDLRENLAVYVGGLEPIYHVRELVDAVGRLDDWSLLVLGSGSEADYVERAAASGDVAFPGTVPHEDVSGYLHAADVGVSLVDDPNTLKVLEYGAAGLPTVQLAGRAESRLGDAVEYCEADPGSVAAAIERAHGRETESLREIAREYSWASIADDYFSVLERVAGAATGEAP